MAGRKNYYKERAERDPEWRAKQIARTKKWKEQNREKVRAYAKQYNPQYHRERYHNDEQYRQKVLEGNKRRDKAKVRDASLKYYRANKEKFRELRKQWYRANTERSLANSKRWYRDNNPTAGILDAISKLRSGAITLDEFVGLYSAILARTDEIISKPRKSKRKPLRDGAAGERDMQLRKRD